MRASENHPPAGPGFPITRRKLLLQMAPTCGLACLGLGGADELAGATSTSNAQERHKFDVPIDPPPPLSQRSLTRLQNSSFMGFIRTLRSEMGEEELIRLLCLYSETVGRTQGEAQAERASDTSFQTFVAQFRPPRYADSLTHEVVVDTPDTFELRVTECVWASVFREAGLGGEIGHAAVCNMDYAWPTAFNPAIRMERSKTLMRGDDCCNHRYVLDAMENQK